LLGILTEKPRIVPSKKDAIVDLNSLTGRNGL
jgi:hypothetical protein